MLLGALFLGGCGSTETGVETPQKKEQRESREVRKEARKVPVEFPLETHNYDLFQNSNVYGLMTVWMTESTEYPSLLTFEAEEESTRLLSADIEGPLENKSLPSELYFSCNRKTIFAKRVR